MIAPPATAAKGVLALGRTTTTNAASALAMSQRFERISVINAPPSIWLPPYCLPNDLGAQPPVRRLS